MKHLLDVLDILLDVLYTFISLIYECIVVLQPAFKDKSFLLLLLLLHKALMLVCSDA